MAIIGPTLPGPSSKKVWSLPYFVNTKGPSRTCNELPGGHSVAYRTSLWFQARFRLVSDPLREDQRHVPLDQNCHMAQHRPDMASKWSKIGPTWHTLWHNIVIVHQRTNMSPTSFGDRHHPSRAQHLGHSSQIIQQGPGVGLTRLNHAQPSPQMTQGGGTWAKRGPNMPSTLLQKPLFF